MRKLLNRSVHSPTTMLQFHDCSFENNTSNNSRYEFSYSNVLGEVNEGFGRGGGLYALFDNSLTNVNLSFLQCKFVANKAFLGGGLSVNVYGNGTKNIHIVIVDSIFEQNGCSSKYGAGYGGGAHLTLHTTLHSSGITNTHYSIKNVMFTANCAELGGGIYHFSTRQDIQKSNSMTFEDCTFKMNKAHMGSAVMMAPNVDRSLSVGYSITFRFVKCQFLNNAVYLSLSAQNQKIPGIGTVYISSYNIYFQEYISFSNNSGSALYIIDAVVNFQESNTNFCNNTGLLGGAIALIGSSKMILGRKSYNFMHNTAKFKGGATYVSLTDNLDFISTKDCFIQYAEDQGKGGAILSNDWKVNVTFIGNRAKDSTAGHAIFATSLRSCQLIYWQNNYTIINTSNIFSIRHFTLNFDDDWVAQIATDGATLHNTKSLPLRMIPGEIVNHGVLVFDDLDQHINGYFLATVIEK